MKTAIIPIGNSKGIRIPKILLEECHIRKNVFLEVKGYNIIIKPVKEESRKGWEQEFKRMNENKDDQLIIDDNIDLDAKNWKWK